MLDLRAPVCPALGLNASSAVEDAPLPGLESYLVKLSCVQPLQRKGHETSGDVQLLPLIAKLSTSCCQHVSKK